jgi:iron complex outermembrane receptor protein
MRIEIIQRPLGPLSGSIGGQIADRSLRTTETTSYLPSVVTAERSAFLAERLALSPLTLSGGIRYDEVRYDLDEASCAPAVDRVQPMPAIPISTC